MRPWKIALLAILVFLAGLVALFPASLAVRWFLPEIPGLVLGAAEGSAWNGRVDGVEYNGWNAGNLHWSLNPLGLLLLRADADLRLARTGGEITAEVKAGMGGSVLIENLRGTLTVADLENARLVPPNFATGELVLNVESLMLEDGRPISAAGRIGLVRLQSPLLPRVALGDYAGEISTPEAGNIVLRFNELEAPLQVRGDATLDANGSYRVAGRITPLAATPEQIRRGLVFLGSPDNSGAYPFSFQGTL